MGGDSLLAKTGKQLHGILDGSMYATCPSACYFPEMHVVLKIKLIHELVIDFVVQHLLGERQFHRWSIDVELDDDKVIFVERRQDRVERVHLGPFGRVHGYV